MQLLLHDIDARMKVLPFHHCKDTIIPDTSKQTRNKLIIITTEAWNSVIVFLFLTNPLSFFQIARCPPNFEVDPPNHVHMFYTDRMNQSINLNLPSFRRRWNGIHFQLVLNCGTSTRTCTRYRPTTRTSREKSKSSPKDFEVLHRHRSVDMFTKEKARIFIWIAVESSSDISQWSASVGLLSSRRHGWRRDKVRYWRVVAIWCCSHDPLWLPLSK